MLESKYTESDYYTYLGTFQLPKSSIGGRITDYIYDYSNKKTLNKLATHIFVGKVITLDGATTMYDGSTPHVLKTYGSIEVLANFKGNAEPDITFLRDGGVTTMKKYYEHVLPAQINKVNFQRKQNGLSSVSESSELMTSFEMVIMM